eukprot:Plantae.Rhodophyta-Purpureofilum_apyrenoidigerum.ctg3368.p1 GENE.Plantae.Rhodophyta-Purpureofilum_apyrenoidigerum.ctg3368~~Plantae.Rhodophyta-Purpureofilum_apyrenoidigerum.ctg3368.p1  ORF type:complete len:148 (-),score=3.18 Plantae.Rhodophyta-Purpureofilum_apyrenoidigerum.ctg3368:67-510(-)
MSVQPSKLHRYSCVQDMLSNTVALHRNPCLVTAALCLPPVDTALRPHRAFNGYTQPALYSWSAYILGGDMQLYSGHHSEDRTSTRPAISLRAAFFLNWAKAKPLGMLCRVPKFAGVRRCRMEVHTAFTSTTSNLIWQTSPLLMSRST